METYSPDAMEKAPATSPAMPANRTTAPPGWAPAKPKMSDTLVTSPSLTPNTAARAPPPCDAAVMVVPGVQLQPGAGVGCRCPVDRAGGARPGRGIVAVLH